MKILTGYLLREHVGPFVAALGVLTGLMLMNQLAKRFGELVGKGLPWHLIAQVFGLSIPFIVAMTMPMAVLVAVLYTFSRLSSDNEVTAIKASGVSLFRLMVPVLLAATALASAMVAFNDYVLPESNHALRRLLTDIGRKQPTFELRERVINEVVPGKLFIKAARIDRVRSVLWDLVIFDLGRPESERTIYADSGHMAFNDAQTDLYLTLYDGSMHEREADDPGTDQRSHYSKQVIRVSDVSNELERGSGISFRGDREMSISMMQGEVQKRRARLDELEDSVHHIITALVRPTRSSRYGAGAIGSDSPDEPIPLSPETTPARRATRSATAARTARVQGRRRSEGIEGENTPRAAGRRTILSPSRRPGWPPSGNAVAYASRVRAEFQRVASRAELHHREMSRYAVEIHKKISIPVAAIVFVLIGAPIGVRFPRGGAGMVIGVSLAVFCVYYVFLIGGEEFADRNIISPFWAMWTTNALFAAVGVGILHGVTRGPLWRRSGPGGDSDGSSTLGRSVR